MDVINSDEVQQMILSGWRLQCIRQGDSVAIELSTNGLADSIDESLFELIKLESLQRRRITLANELARISQLIERHMVVNPGRD